MADADFREKLLASALKKAKLTLKDTGNTMKPLSSLMEVKRGFCTTSITPLDIAIANRVDGGAPYGKVMEINGHEASGKSLLLATILANNQKRGGLSFLIDNEDAVEPSFYQAIGMDISQLGYSNIGYIEDAFQIMEDIILDVRKADPEIPIMIGFDSVAGAKTKNDDETYEKGGYNTSKAIIMSQKLPKLVTLCAQHDATIIMTQQLRVKVGQTMGSNITTASGGSALKYYASVRLRVKKLGKIKAGNLVVGVKSSCTVEKNRLGPPFREADFEIYFDAGIDDYAACLDKFKFYDIIAGKTWKEWTEDMHLPGVDITWKEKGEAGKGKAAGFYPKFQMKQWRAWMENDEFRKAVADKIAELSISRYKGHMGSEDNTILTEEQEAAEFLKEEKELQELDKAEKEEKKKKKLEEVLEKV
jgi:recombination protein RecA